MKPDLLYASSEPETRTNNDTHTHRPTAPIPGHPLLHTWLIDKPPRKHYQCSLQPRKDRTGQSCAPDLTPFQKRAVISGIAEEKTRPDAFVSPWPRCLADVSASKREQAEGVTDCIRGKPGLSCWILRMQCIGAISHTCSSRRAYHMDKALCSQSPQFSHLHFPPLCSFTYL